MPDAAAAPGAQKNIVYHRIYAAADGESHFATEQMTVTTHRVNDSLLHSISEHMPIRDVMFRTVLEDDYVGSFHAAGEPGMAILLAGNIEIEVSDGEVRTLGPGDIMLVEDTSGKGHLTRAVGGLPRVTMHLRFEKTVELSG